MLNYADYTFYSGSNYKGMLDESLFNSLIPKASREIDKVVNRDIKEADLNASYGNKIKFVACELVDFLNKYENGSNSTGNISSISIDGVHKTYAAASKSEISQEKAKITDGLPHELTRFL